MLGMAQIIHQMKHESVSHRMNRAGPYPFSYYNCQKSSALGVPIFQLTDIAVIHCLLEFGTSSEACESSSFHF